MQERRTSGRAARCALVLVVLATACAACEVGTITRERFDEEVRSRGGGIGERLAFDAIEAVEDELDVDHVEVRSMLIADGDVWIEVRVPGTTGAVDAYNYGPTSPSTEITDALRIRSVRITAGSPPLEAVLFRPDQAQIDELDQKVDRALDEAGLTDGYVERVFVRRPARADGPATTVTVTNGRSTKVVTYGADGSLTTTTAR